MNPINKNINRTYTFKLNKNRCSPLTHQGFSPYHFMEMLMSLFSLVPDNIICKVYWTHISGSYITYTNFLKKNRRQNCERSSLLFLIKKTKILPSLAIFGRPDWMVQCMVLLLPCDSWDRLRLLFMKSIYP